MSDKTNRISFMEGYEALCKKYKHYIAPPPGRSLYVRKKWGTVDKDYEMYVDELYKDIGL